MTIVVGFAGFSKGEKDYQSSIRCCGICSMSGQPSSGLPSAVIVHESTRGQVNLGCVGGWRGVHARKIRGQDASGTNRMFMQEVAAVLSESQNGGPSYIARTSRKGPFFPGP